MTMTEDQEAALLAAWQKWLGYRNYVPEHPSPSFKVAFAAGMEQARKECAAQLESRAFFAQYGGVVQRILREEAAKMIEGEK